MLEPSGIIFAQETLFKTARHYSQILFYNICCEKFYCFFHFPNMAYPLLNTQYGLFCCRLDVYIFV